jgi:hypothetical protein
MFGGDLAHFAEDHFLLEAVEFIVIESHIVESLEISTGSKFVQEIINGRFQIAVETAVEVRSLMEVLSIHH